MREDLKKQISEYNPDALLIDGYANIEDFDDAILGIGNQHGRNPVVIYSKKRCIQILTEQFEKEECEDPYLDAVEYFDYNIGCAYVGENTPIFLEDLD